LIYPGIGDADRYDVLRVTHHGQKVKSDVCTIALLGGAGLLAHHLCAKCRREGLTFCCWFLFLVISARPVISTYTRPIFTKFAGLVELWTQMNDLKFFFDPSGDIAMATNMTFAREAAPAYDKKGNCYAECRQTNYLI